MAHYDNPPMDVKYLVWYTLDIIGDQIKDECIIIDNKKYANFADWKDERNSTDELPANYGISKKTPYIKNLQKILRLIFLNRY